MSIIHKDLVSFDSTQDPLSSLLVRFCATPLRVNTCKIIRFDKTVNKKNMPREFHPRIPLRSLQHLAALFTAYSGKELADRLRSDANKIEVSGDDSKAAEERIVYLVLADLAALGWRFRVVRGAIYMVPGNPVELGNAQAKEILRRPLLYAREAQLAEPANQAFFTFMQRPRKFKGELVSIEDLVEDGASLADALSNHAGKDLRMVVDPYLQLVDSTSRCEQTGLKLVDIWRYFRHTWSLIYRPTPGRTINFLLRNAARPNHPVIGIIGLANAVYQLSSRDQWIGWTVEGIIERVRETPEYWSEFRQRAIACLERSKSVIREDDLLAEIGEVTDPRLASSRLATLAFQQGEARKESLKATFLAESGSSSVSKAVPKSLDGTPDWKAASEEMLFKRKRAEVLSDIIFASHILRNSTDCGKEVIDAVEVTKRPDGDLRMKWTDTDLERAVKVALREIKKNGVSTRILDVNVCGAAPTYREILGGKLAALSLFSEEVQQAYCQRYGKAVSEIASAMAGRPISRPTRISILTTTSLYGVGSSQYNRIRVTIGGETLEWKKIGVTEGYGTVHISPITIEAIRKFSIAKRGMRNVNNKFGEGTSPLMRQLREGLTALGFESNDVLKHSNPRVVYALELYPNARRDLCLDIGSNVRNPSMSDISKSWIDRWLAMRIQSEAVLKKVAQNSASTVKADLIREEHADVSKLPLLGEA